VPDPPHASGAALLRGPEPLVSARTHRTSCDALVATGRRLKCAGPSTWPEPSAEHHCEDAGYGSMRVRAWAELHHKVENHKGRGSRRPLPIVVGTFILVEVEWLSRIGRRRESLIWRSYVRRLELEHTFRFLKQSTGWTTPRVRHAEHADKTQRPPLWARQPPPGARNGCLRR